MDGGNFLNAGVLHLVATKAYERTATGESETSRDCDDALVALLFSAAALEALIMELAIHAESGAHLFPQQSPADVLAPILNETESSRGSARLKYLVSKAILSGRSYDKGSKPYQDFDLLFSIRDAIVHMKPERMTEAPHKIVAALRAMGLCEKPEDNVRYSWLHDIMTRAVARWACNVVPDMAESLSECFPEHAEMSINPYTAMAFATRRFKRVE